MPIIAVDVGTGYCKALGEARRVIFPSLILKRYPTPWEYLKTVDTTLVGETAESALTEPGWTLRPVRESKIFNDDAYLTIVREALGRMGFSARETKALFGVPTFTSKTEREKIERMLRRQVKFSDVRLMPSTFGTLLAIGRDSGVVVDIGEGTSDFLIVDKREIVRLDTTPVATDSVFWAVRDHIISEDGLELKLEEIRGLTIGTLKSVRKYTPLVGVKTITSAYVLGLVKKEVKSFAEEIVERSRLFLASAPSGSLENIILTGGGAKIFHDALSTQMSEVKFEMPKDPIYANAEGLFMLAKEIFRRGPRTHRDS